MSDIKADKVQNSIGQTCPMPIVHMAKNIKTMEGGQVIEIHADDDGAHADVPSWCEQTGNEFLGEEDAGEYFKYFVRKSG